jgi:hypothetical protein
MSDLLLIPAVYVAGALSGHVVVTWVKKELAALHTKLDSVIQKLTVNVFKR